MDTASHTKQNCGASRLGLEITRFVKTGGPLTKHIRLSDTSAIPSFFLL